jgi:hypothetical protein
MRSGGPELFLPPHGGSSTTRHLSARATYHSTYPCRLPTCPGFRSGPRLACIGHRLFQPAHQVHCILPGSTRNQWLSETRSWKDRTDELPGPDTPEARPRGSPCGHRDTGFSPPCLAVRLPPSIRLPPTLALMSYHRSGYRRDRGTGVAPALPCERWLANGTGPPRYPIRARITL